MFKYQHPVTNFGHASHASIFPGSNMSSIAFSQHRWTSDIKVGGPGIVLANRLYSSIRALASVITSTVAPIARFRGELVPGKMCSCRGLLGSAGGLELLTADIVALWVASGDEYGGTLKDVNAGGVCALPWIIPRGAPGVRLTGATTCHPQLVETRTFGTRLFSCCLSAVSDRRRVPGPGSSSGLSLSSASGSVSDFVYSDLGE